MSDYTPPTLVTPTPGGSAGDGSLNGALTVQANIDINNTAKSILIAGNGADVLIETDSGGNIDFWDVSHSTNYIALGNGTDNLSLNGNLRSGGKYTAYNGVGTVGLGVAPLYGKDVRTGLTAADASATTLYTTTAAGQVYEVVVRIFGAGGTITSGIYTIGWTEGGTARTATVSITAAGTMDSAIFLLQPDNGTAITGQLTTLSGTSPVVNVAAILKEDV